MRLPTPRSLIAVPAIAAGTIFFSILVLAQLALFPRGRFVHRLVRAWARFTAFAAGMKVTLIGAERLDGGKAYVVVSNHQSHMDAPALLAVSPVPLRMLGKKSLFSIPVFGWALGRAGNIPIDRREGKTDFETLRRGCDTLGAAGMSLCVFAEGRRSDDGRLQPFKSGAFHIAAASGLPIVPVSIRGTFDVLPARTLRFRAGRAEVVFHEPIDSGSADPRELRDRVREIIARGLE